MPDYARLKAAIASAGEIEVDIAELEALIADPERGQKWFLCLEGSPCRPINIDADLARDFIQERLMAKTEQRDALDAALSEATKKLP